nr:hypothetical protein [Tanacetum cinerariifolium]
MVQGRSSADALGQKPRKWGSPLYPNPMKLYLKSVLNTMVQGRSSADALGQNQGIPKLNARILLLHFDHSK